MHRTSQNEVKNYFKSLLAPANKVHPDTSKSFIQNHDRSIENLNYDDPTTIRKERESILKSPRSPESSSNERNNLDIFQTVKKSSTIHYRGSKLNSVVNIAPINGSDRIRKSVANLGKMMGQMAKSVMSDINLSQKRQEFNDAYIKSLDSAFRFIDSSKSPFLKKLKQFLFFNVQIFIFLMTLLSVINIVLVTDYRIGVLDQTYERPLMIAEWAVGSFFGLEVLLTIISTPGISKKIKQLFSVPVIGNILLILEIISTTAIGTNFQRVNKIFVFIYILRSMKLFKLRKVIQFTTKEFKKMMRNDKFQIESKNEQSELKNFVYNSALDIIIGIFIEASCFLAVDEALDYQGYSSSNGDVNFDYIGSCYYSIVSITTIGYGDICPSRWESRMFNVVIMFVNITVISSFIGTMTEKMYELSPYIRDFYFKNHIVIIGNIPQSFCKYFLKELHQCDLLTSTVYSNDKSSALKASKIILIGNENPANDFEIWLERFSNDHTEICYLKSNVLENLWHKQANLGSARHLFAFSMNPNETQAQGFESDKQMAYNIQNVVNNFPKLDITLVLSTEFSYHIKNDSLWSKVTVISPTILNEYIMANSLENQGLNIWLTHLATLREKSAAVDKGSDLNHLEEYAQNMGQEIYPIKLPSFFVGKTFQEVLKLSYFSTIDLSDSFSFDYTDNMSNNKTLPNRSGILLIGIEYRDEMDPSTAKFLINPINYKIRRDDIGYVVAYDQTNAKIITNLSEKSQSHSIYLKNMNLFKKLKVIEASHKSVDKLRVQMINRLHDWKINKKKYYEKTHYKNVSDFDSKLYEIPDIFNLYVNITPKGIFKNHIIIKCDLFRLKRIASVLRSYSERPIILFSDEDPNPSEWHKIRDAFRNIFYVCGCTTNINHLMQIDPKKAFKILVLSSSKNNSFFMDSDSIVFTRIIADFFEVKNFLTELMDENNLKYISINPKYDNLDYFFWPFFVRGSIHFSSLAMSIVAKSINNKSWLSFIRNLTKPNKYVENNLETYEQNSRINTLEITEETRKEFQFFGQLQYVLMSHEPQVIAIAVLKAKYSSQPKKTTILRQMSWKNADKNNNNEIKKNKKIEHIFSQHILKIMDNFYGSEFLMTNPSFLMPLDIGDRVLVIGNTKIEDTNEYYGKMISSSMKITTPLNQTQNEIINFSQKENINHATASSKQGVFKEKLEENLTNFNDFLKFILNNYDELNESKQKSY